MFVTWDRDQSVTLGSEPSSQETKKKSQQWVHETSSDVYCRSSNGMSNKTEESRDQQ